MLGPYTTGLQLVGREELLINVEMATHTDYLMP